MKAGRATFGDDTVWGNQKKKDLTLHNEALQRMRRDLKKLEWSRQQRHQQPLVNTKPTYCTFERLDIGPPSVTNHQQRQQMKLRMHPRPKSHQEPKSMRTLKIDQHNAPDSPIVDARGLPKSISFSAMCIPDAARDPPRVISRSASGPRPRPRTDRIPSSLGKSAEAKRKPSVPTFRAAKDQNLQQSSRASSTRPESTSKRDKPGRDMSPIVVPRAVEETWSRGKKPALRAPVPRQPKRATSAQQRR